MNRSAVSLFASAAALLAQGGQTLPMRHQTERGGRQQRDFDGTLDAAFSADRSRT